MRKYIIPNMDVNPKQTQSIKYDELDGADLEFYDRISNSVTSSHAIPWDLPVDATFDIIVKALKFFWEWKGNATEEVWYYLPTSEIVKHPKGTGFQVPLPTNIQDVFAFKPASGAFNTTLANFMRMNLLKTYTYSSGGVAGGGGNFRSGYKDSMPSMSNISIQLMEFSNYKEMYGKSIHANFNNNTSRLTIRGNNPDYNGIVLGVFERLLPEYLYTDLDFENYVKAMVEQNIGKILSFTKFKLIGNVEINYEQIQKEGADAVKEIENEIKKQNHSNFIFFKN